MAFIDWSDDYSVSVDIFDREHQSLIAIINELHQGLTSGFGIKEMTYILDRLLEYTSKHFYHEEKEMHAYAYPDFDVHKKAHEQLVADVKKYKDRLESGEQAFSLELLAFLKKWLVNHILGTDKKYSKFFAGKNI